MAARIRGRPAQRLRVDRSAPADRAGIGGHGAAAGPVAGPGHAGSRKRGELTTGELYLLLLEIGSAWLPPFLAVAAHGPGPLFVHCAAGKDRTGVAVALLLRSAGVDRATVAADFAATNDHRRALRDRLVAQGSLGEDVPAERVGVTPEHIEPVLDVLDDDPRRPLLEAGVPAADLDAWRERLVDGT